MKFLGIEIEGNFEVKDYPDYFELWQNGKEVYLQKENGYWCRSFYDEKGNEIFWRSSKETWKSYEYDEEGNEIYYEDCYGNVRDSRPKPKTKKVFRLWKYLENKESSMELKIMSVFLGWPQECEGKTKEEVSYSLSPSWMVEEKI